MTKRGNKITVNFIINTKKPFYISLSNRYSTLPHFAADPPPHQSTPSTTPAQPAMPSNFKNEAQHQALAHQACCTHKLSEDNTIDTHITWAKDDITSLAKANTNVKCRRAIDLAHRITNNTVTGTKSILQQGCCAGYAFSSTLHRACQSLSPSPHVHFQSQSQIWYYNPVSPIPMITYDYGANGYYLCKTDHINTGLNILKP
jgi:hypothetical protein